MMRIIFELESEGINPLLRQLLSYLEGMATTSTTIPAEQGNSSVLLCDYIRSAIQKENVAVSTRKNKETTLRWISRWYQNLQLRQITVDFIPDFIRHMKEQQFQDGTISKHLHQLRHYLYQAVKEGLVAPALHDPNLYAYKVEKYHHSFLSPEELALLEEYDPKMFPAHWETARQAFLFSCYTGLRFSDIKQLTTSHIQKKGDIHWLALKTQKTGIEIHLPLELLFQGKTLSIYNKVKGKPNAKCFKLGTNTATNKILQRIQNHLGLSTHISFHTARHTFATNLLYMDVRLEVIQKLLGHHNIKTTQIYAEMTDAALVKALQNNWLKP